MREAILELKRKHNAVILAHNYIIPEIFHGIADITGDSLALARKAAEIKADVIVVCGVHFMAETVKLLNPNKLVLIPDPLAGCSLAESITPEDVQKLRHQHPGAPVITYVNTSAALKAECDVCCTSGNVLKVVEAFPQDEIILVPDQHLAAYAASTSDKKIITHPGSCEVHIQFDAREIQKIKKQYGDDLEVIAHPECPREILAISDAVGSTAGMIERVGQSPCKNILLVTEKSLAQNISDSFPQKNLIDSCKICPHMKRITMENVLSCLQKLETAVEVDLQVAQAARKSVQNMLEIK